MLLSIENDDFFQTKEDFISIPKDAINQDPEMEEQENRTLADPLQRGDQIAEQNNTIHSQTTDEDLDLGFPVVCNLCDEEFSSKVILRHCSSQHRVENGTIRTLSRTIPMKPDSIYNNKRHIKPGLVLVDKEGNYAVLKSKFDNDVWEAEKFPSSEKVKLKILDDIATSRAIGWLSKTNGEELEIIDLNSDDIKSYHSSSFKPKVFITSDNQREEESTYVVNIPKSRHGEEKCVKAKQKELKNFENFDVYEIVDIPEDPKAVIIDTEWVLVEKEIAQTQEYETKARLCLRGDQERNKHLTSWG